MSQTATHVHATPAGRRATVLAVAAVCWGAFALGGAHPWGYWPLAVLCVATAVAGIRGAAHGCDVSRPLLAALGAVGLAAAVQLVPLPISMLESVSPRSLSLLADTDFRYGAGLVHFHPLSVEPSSTAVALTLYVAFAAMMIGLTRSLGGDRVRRLVEVLTVVGVLLALTGIVQKPLYSGRVLGVWEPQAGGSPFGPFVNKNHFAGWLLMALPLTLSLLCAGLQQGMRGLRPGFRYKVLWLSSPEANRLILVAAAAVLMAMALMLTMSRSGITAFAVSLMLTGWLVSRGFDGTSRRAAIAAYLALLIITTVGWVGADAIVDRFSQANWSEFNNRHGAWADAVTVISSFPYAGTGLNTYPVAARFYQQHDLGVFFGEAHNDYLQLAAEGGLLLVLPVLVCIGLFLLEVRRRGQKDTMSTAWWLRRGALMGLVAIALQETVDFSLQMPANAVLFAVLCAIALHRPGEQPHPGHPARPAPRPRLRVVASNALAGSR